MMVTVRNDLPSGTVTFLFTDVEGSTRLLHRLGAEAYATALAEQRRILRAAVGAHGGVEVDAQGDGFFLAFPTAPGALAAAAEGQRGLDAGPIRVRMGIHTGTPRLTADGYVGLDVHRGARIAAAAHGGQVVLSAETRLLLDDSFPVADLGQHRLKDFAETVGIFQLGSERFPPLRTIANTNLPRPASSFVGRRSEVKDVVSRMRHGARLVTLTGPGGSGKTRLAIEAAAELVPEFSRGVFWVALASLRDPALVTATIAQGLGAKDSLASHIGEGDMLVLLDNVEQVVESAPELSSLLVACPNLRLLVTSRELLRISGEVEYMVPPLAEPEAVELFCARSRLEPNELIAELTGRLDHLPLALELAAARTSILSPAQILERVSERLDLLKGGRDAEARQQTLRATIAWSHDLLTDKEQRLFARLSVFAGGSTLEAVEEITDADLDTLQSIVDKSLLRHRDERFAMLETIREFAAERLEAAGEADELRRRHAEHFLALAEMAEPNLRGSPKQWLDRLDAEHDNLRAALDWLETTGQTQPALRLAGALSRFWDMRSHPVEGRKRLESLLLADLTPTSPRAKALYGAAVMAVSTGDPATARLRAQDALVLNQTIGDAWGTAYSHYMLGVVATEESDWAAAQPLFTESLRTFGDLGDEHYVLLATDALAWTYGELGDGERRRALHRDILARALAQSNETIVALQLAQLATFALDEGGGEDALAMLKESLRIYRDLGTLSGIAENLCRLAGALAGAGRATIATKLLSRADALRQEIGGVASWVGETNDETLARIHAQIDEDAFAAAWTYGQTLTVDEVVALAFDSSE